MTQNAVGYFNVAELERSNRASEAETHRKNKATEAHNAASLSETSRHNREMEAHQLRQLYEQARHNLANEDIGQQGINVDWSKLAETARANRAAEAELYRSHRIQEVEAMRHNKASELAGYVSAGGALARGYGSIVGAQAQKSQARTAKERARIEADRNRWQRSEATHRNIQGYGNLLLKGADTWYRGMETKAKVVDTLGRTAKSLFSFGF